MNKKGYTTESGGRQNGFAIEPEINPISEGESKKSIFLFIVFVRCFTLPIKSEKSPFFSPSLSYIL